MSRFSNAKVILSSLALFSCALAAHAEDPYYTVEGSAPATIHPRRHGFSASADGSSETKVIQLKKIKPSARLLAQNAKNRAAISDSNGELDYSNGITPFSQSPGAVDLGMSNVPVLDQGQYGTCVTFSSTAAIDARFNLSDDISQQCLLALTNSLGDDFWDGANVPSDLLTPLTQYGIVSKTDCPEQYADQGEQLSTSDYTAISDTTYSSQINLSYAEVTTTSLNDVKAALKSGKRVIIGTFLAASDSDPISVDGFDINVGGQQDSGGLWACQQSSSFTNYCPPQSELSEGHEIVVIGYDDTQQLLKIRNSWNTQVGDNGDYYMTYTFFSSMVTDYTIVN